ncbi:hypothetical protein AaE_012415 [Aphanomyces astaci]|uniref:Uncharacterized protein n=1 Tax=Aphanomyces astaci TaxID=112090 RepID=A0A6A4ZBB7_APHAT|nr:hypothetical protein AaE_012415 [Aphanomyces astaci]
MSNSFLTPSSALLRRQAIEGIMSSEEVSLGSKAIPHMRSAPTQGGTGVSKKPRVPELSLVLPPRRMLQDARSSADCVASDDEPPTLNDVVSRRKWTSGDPRRGRQGLWMYEGLYSDGKSKWLYRGHPDECQQPRLFDVVDRYEAYVAIKPGHHGHATLSLGDFKKADVNYNRKIGARSGMDCVEQAVFSATEGLDVKEAKRLVDWFMARGFSIDRSVYNKSCMRNRPVGICGILDDNGPEVYVIYTSDVSLLGHYWTEDPPCAITGMKDYIHHVHFIRKCVKKLGHGSNNTANTTSFGS